MSDIYEMTSEDIKKYKLTLDDIEKLEEDDINIINISTDMAKDIMPKAKVIKKVLAVKEIKETDYMRAIEEFSKIMIATSKKK